MQDADLPVAPPATYKQLIEYANIINQPQENKYGFGVNGQDPHRLYKKILPII
jgi:ABC-type glycerol-3-phosphate transport system substrate-binding protein